ncbi:MULTISPECIES: 2-hydroxychromene-2-carboxylate isomerase [Sphingopyxis]|jgi:2-hydroxychromene-2-carboxylate isomerase|uniref:2-hydroxychromene-2-carboxylate isomerase n=1 Tax=Sphingopyxis TaxID=165697 RepID=UPI0007375237|nr:MULTISPECIES: 2-hydroxychromene-2-carboxylate isomerase [Sphingopyxis]KTE22749.1 disulfide bond formation protein DsbA [Sphingopyxis sp. H050]KTE40421.1 disulfide bond formation protein DsbA [Sphingopyxis sp. HIX]KTE85083.1 disulfide bond formation protein DsbA [Sphingopyxis sp. HXXIV]
MTSVIDFYFDFISPFSYLAHVRLPAMARAHGRTLAYHPIDIPEAKIAAGNYGPSNREVPAKIKVLMADLGRWADRYEVPLAFPASFECSEWNIAAIYAAQCGAAEAFVADGYRRIWGIGIDPRDDQELRAASSTAGLDPDEVTAFVTSGEGALRYREARSKAYARGVFGAPMMFVDDQIFWGNDRLDFLEGYLRLN